LLNQSQLQTLENHNPLTVGALDAEQLGLLSHYVFHSDQFRNSVVPLETKTEAESARNREMSELMPDGLPATTTLTMDTTTEKTYFVKIRTDTSAFTQEMNISTLAYYVTYKDHPAPESGWNPVVLSIEPGVKRTITLHINCSDRIAGNATISEAAKVAGGPWTLDKLPSDLKAQLDKEIAMRKQVEGQIRDQAGSPPPATPPS